MLTDLDNDIFTNNRHDTIQETELIKVAKDLQLAYNAFWNDHYYGEVAKFDFSLACIRSPQARNLHYYSLSFNLFGHDYQKGAKYDLHDFDKALQLIHDRVDKILRIVDCNYSKDYYLKYVRNYKGDDRVY